MLRAAGDAGEEDEGLAFVRIRHADHGNLAGGLVFEAERFNKCFFDGLMRHHLPGDL